MNLDTLSANTLVANTHMADLARMFTPKTRDNGASYWVLEDAPEWASDMVREAHAGMLPNDTSYQMIYDLAWRMADYDADQWDACCTEIIDSAIDAGYHELLAWVSSNLTRMEYCNEAIHDGLAGELGNILMAGQERELSFIFDCIVSAITDQLEA